MLFVAKDNPRVEVRHQEIVGPPDLVVEVASPSTAGCDRHQKQDTFARAGVPEYWIPDPILLTIEILRLGEDGKYVSLGVFSGQQKLPTVVLAGLPYSVEKLLS